MSHEIRTTYGAIWVKDLVSKQLHNDAGPAVEVTSGPHYLFYLHGREVSFDRWCEEANPNSSTVTFWLLKLGKHNR